jgi:Zn-dependent membrane protease YugP
MKKFTKEHLIKKYKDFPCEYNGFQVAQRILEANRLKDVKIIRKEGNKTNYYSALSKTIFLSSNVCDIRSITSCAIAAQQAACAIRNANQSNFLMYIEKFFSFFKSYGIYFLYFIVVFIVISPSTLISYLCLISALIIIFILISLIIKITTIRITIKNLRDNTILRFEEEISAIKDLIIANFIFNNIDYINSTDIHT